MPIQVYECREHGEILLTFNFSDDVPATTQCPYGPHMASWTPSTPSFIIKGGGTGAQRNPRR